MEAEKPKFLDDREQGRTRARGLVIMDGFDKLGLVLLKSIRRLDLSEEIIRAAGACEQLGQ